LRRRVVTYTLGLHRQSPIKKWWLLWGKERQTLNADYRMRFEECHSSDWL